MPVFALVAYVVFTALAFGLRSWIHYRRTGTTGFVGLSGKVGSAEWVGGVLFVLALLAGAAAPMLALVGVSRPIAALDGPAGHMAGVLLFVAGLVGTLWAQLAMGSSWRIGVDQGARTALVASGPFAWVRNPIFTAMTLATLGLVLLVPNAVSLVALATLAIALEIQVRRVEEPYLLRSHGEEYRRYAAGTGRFLPGIGRLTDGRGEEHRHRHAHGAHFVPALGADFLTPLYDFVAWMVGETRFKRRLVETASIAAGQDVLDVGCGTGTLALMVKDACPGARVVGLDVDPKILAIAQRKAAQCGRDIELCEGSATDPPLAPGSFDRVLTTLMLHHLTTPQKREALRSIRALLRPEGELHVADWGKPHNPLMRLAALSFRLVDGGETTAANLRGELPKLIAEAGFAGVEETERWMTPFGTLAFISARRLS